VSRTGVASRPGRAAVTAGAGAGVGPGPRAGALARAPVAARLAAAALRAHWPEYLIEAAGLAAFMVSACAFAALLEHPASPVRQALPDPLVRRIPMGLAMGGTALALIYSPWGRRSGAHFNPATTLAFWRLGKVAGADAAYYVLAQFGGALAGVGLAGAALGAWVAASPVRFAVTEPGPGGAGVAFVAELAMGFALMSVVLAVSNRADLARWTGACAAAVVAACIVVEAPLSGMSLNPARTTGSAAWAGRWTALWVYLTAPALGMLLAAELRRRRSDRAPVRCAKLQHDGPQRCIFRCGYAAPGR
jgi:aquaporin Z